MAEFRDRYDRSPLRILWVQAKQVICENKWLFSIGAMHCFLLVGLEDNNVLKIDRDKTNFYVNDATESHRNAQSASDRVNLDGVLRISQLYTYLRDFIQKEYKIFKNNCFSFVKDILEKLHVPPETIDRLLRSKSVTETNTIQHGVTQATQAVAQVATQAMPPEARNRAIQFLSTVWDDFMDQVMKQKGNVQEIIKKAWPPIKDALTKFVKEQFPIAVKKGWEGIEEIRKHSKCFYQSTKKIIEERMPGVIKEVLESAKTKLNQLAEGIASGWKSSAVGKKLSELSEKMCSSWRQTSIAKRIAEATDEIQVAWANSSFRKALSGIIQKVAEKAAETARYIRQCYTALYKNVGNKLQEWSAKYMPKLSEATSQYCSKITANYDKLCKGISDFCSQATNASSKGFTAMTDFCSKISAGCSKAYEKMLPTLKVIKEKVMDNLPLVLSLISNTIQEGKDLYYNKDKTWRDYVKCAGNIAVRTAVDMAVYKSSTFIGAQIGGCFAGPAGCIIGGVVGFGLSLAGGIFLPNLAKRCKWLPWNWL